MKATPIIFLSSMILVFTSVIGDELPRDPFWPQDFEGVRHPISLKPRIVRSTTDSSSGKFLAKDDKKKVIRSAEQVAREASEVARRAAEEYWNQARKSLMFGPIMSFSEAGGSSATISINGRPYGPGDYISTNFTTNRFTWKVESLTGDGKLRLRRIKKSPIQGKK